MAKFDDKPSLAFAGLPPRPLLGTYYSPAALTPAAVPWRSPSPRGGDQGARTPASLLARSTRRMQQETRRRTRGRPMASQRTPPAGSSPWIAEGPSVHAAVCPKATRPPSASAWSLRLALVDGFLRLLLCANKFCVLPDFCSSTPVFLGVFCSIFSSKRTSSWERTVPGREDQPVSVNVYFFRTRVTWMPCFSPTKKYIRSRVDAQTGAPAARAAQDVPGRGAAGPAPRPPVPGCPLRSPSGGVHPRGCARPRLAAVCFLPPEAQKKQLEETVLPSREDRAAGSADRATAEPGEGGPDGDGDGAETTDGPEEDSDEDGGPEPVGARPAAPAPRGAGAPAALGPGGARRGGRRCPGRAPRAPSVPGFAHRCSVPLPTHNAGEEASRKDVRCGARSGRRPARSALGKPRRARSLACAH